MYNTKFSVCTFNLFNFIQPPNAFYEIDNIYSQSQWEKKQSWIKRQLLTLQPDIIGFQEVFSPDALKALVAELGYSYFVTVDEPNADVEGHVFDKPVVALASRFAIESATKVSANHAIGSQLTGGACVDFSRAPIRAEVQVNGLGNVQVYVAHLKSKRPQWNVDAANMENIGIDSLLAQQIMAEVQGRAVSMIQRGAEAALLYHDIMCQRLSTTMPMIVMGDLNDVITSAPLAPLVSSQHLDRLAGKYIADMPLKDRREVKDLSLTDAFDMLKYTDLPKRQATHYFANKGNVLDYVLLTQDFNGDYDHSVATVVKHYVSDDHLRNPHSTDDAECSDHAPVLVEIEMRH